MILTLTKRNEKSINITKTTDKGMFLESYIATNTYSAVLVVEALLNNVEPPRNYRNVTVQKIQTEPQ